MKRIVLIGTLLLVFVLTAGTASAQIILPPGWPFLPPIIVPPVIEAPPPAYYPNPYGYYSYPILMAIIHTPMVIMVLGRGVRVTGVMVDGVIMVLGVRVTGVMGGIADNTFFG